MGGQPCKPIVRRPFRVERDLVRERQLPWALQRPLHVQREALPLQCRRHDDLRARLQLHAKLSAHRDQQLIASMTRVSGHLGSIVF